MKARSTRGPAGSPVSVDLALSRRAKLFDDRLERQNDLALVDLALAETHSQMELLCLRLEREQERLRPAALGLGGFFPDVLAGDAPAIHEALDERHHLLRIRLPHDLQERRLGRDVGQPT